jgi:hypothetical protein
MCGLLLWVAVAEIERNRPDIEPIEVCSSERHVTEVPRRSSHVIAPIAVEGKARDRAADTVMSGMVMAVTYGIRRNVVLGGRLRGCGPGRRTPSRMAPPVADGATLTEGAHRHTLGPCATWTRSRPTSAPRGLRVTPEHHLIYSLLADKPNHLTVEAVHAAGARRADVVFAKAGGRL